MVVGKFVSLKIYFKKRFCANKKRERQAQAQQAVSHTDTVTAAHSHPLRPTLHPTQLFTLRQAAKAFARKGKCSGQCIRLNKQPGEAIKQASKIYSAARPEPQSRK